MFKVVLLIATDDDSLISWIMTQANFSKKVVVLMICLYYMILA